MHMDIYRHIVQYYETDKMGITHHSNYIRWMEEARVHLLKEAGWGFSKMEEMGMSSPVVSVECRYRLPSYFEDEISVETSVESITGVKLRIRYVMKNADGRVVCEGRSEHAFFKNSRPLHIERDLPGFFEALKEHLSEQS